MKWLRQLSIYYKINGIIIGMLLLLSFIIGVIMMRTTARLLDQQIEQRGVEVGTYIAVLSSNDILLDDQYALFDRINKTKINTVDVRYILITDSAGRILANTFAGNLPKGLQITPANNFLSSYNQADIISGHQIIKFSSNEGPLREIIVPIENGAIGFVRVGMLENSTQQLLEKKLHEFYITTFLVCLLAMIGATYLAYVIINPLRSLTRAAEQIQRGNLSVQAEVTVGDEVGQLATVFNEMVNSLQEKDLENNRLLKELRDKEAMRTILISKLFTIQEDERKRLSRELHDDANQSLASLLAYMKVLLSKLTNDNQRELLLGARDVAINVLDGLRKMAVELRPPVLDDLGITAAIAKYVNNFSTQQHITVSFFAPDDKLVISNEISLALYRILQESLTNISKHASATEATISLIIKDLPNAKSSDGNTSLSPSYLESKYDILSKEPITCSTKSTITLIISDNGVGLRPGELEVARQNNRLGVYGMKERVELLGGSFNFHSISGHGTTIIVILPITCLE